jgi:hypothetical protein
MLPPQLHQLSFWHNQSSDCPHQLSMLTRCHTLQHRNKLLHQGQMQQQEQQRIPTPAVRSSLMHHLYYTPLAVPLRWEHQVQQEQQMRVRQHYRA